MPEMRKRKCAKNVTKMLQRKCGKKCCKGNAGIRIGEEENYEG